MSKAKIEEINTQLVAANALANPCEQIYGSITTTRKKKKKICCVCVCV
jgi:hypothetical protein